MNRREKVFRYTEEQISKINTSDEIRPRLKGRVMRINKDNRSAVIYRPCKGSRKEIYFRRENCVSNTQFDKKMRVGSEVTFELEEIDGKFEAVNVEVLGHMYDGSDKYFKLPNGQKINCKSVRRYGIADATKTVMRKLNCSYQYIKDNGYTDNDFHYIYIKTVNCTYDIYKKSAPLKSELSVEDLDEYIKYLDQVLVGINPNMLLRDADEYKTKKVDKIWTVVKNNSEFYRVSDILETLRDSNSSRDYDGCTITDIDSAKFEIEYQGQRVWIHQRYAK